MFAALASRVKIYTISAEEFIVWDELSKQITFSVILWLRAAVHVV
jgi:hypothetical protein